MANRLESKADFTGETIGSFLVLARTGHRKYSVRCTTCNTVAEGIRHEDLLNNPRIRCFNAACGKKTFRSWREEYDHELEETLHNEVEKYKKNSNELARLRREFVLKAKDDEFLASQELRSIRSMPSIEDAIQFTRGEAEAFVNEHEWYYPCPENQAQICEYLERQGIDKFCDRSTFSRAAYRLQELGLLKPKPAPAPPPEPEPEPVQVQVEPAEPKTHQGWDDDGNVKQYNDFQVAQMSADEYRRRFRLVKEQFIRPVRPCDW